MEIRKTDRGWEYNGIIFADEASAIGTRKADKKAARAKKKKTALKAEDFKLVYDGERGLSFGKFIEDVLLEQDLRVGALARKLGITPQALFNWMNAVSLPTPKHLAKIMSVTKRAPEEVRQALRDNFAKNEENLFRKAMTSKKGKKQVA